MAEEKQLNEIKAGGYYIGFNGKKVDAEGNLLNKDEVMANDAGAVLPDPDGTEATSKTSKK